MNIESILKWCLCVSLFICTMIYFIVGADALNNYDFFNRVQYAITSVEFPNVIDDVNDVIGHIKNASLAFTSFNASDILSFLKSILNCLISMMTMFVNVLYIPLILVKDVAVTFYSIFMIIINFINYSVV